MRKNIYPPMHTAEHLLNQTMVRTFGTNRCFSAHIEKKKSKCDYYFNRALTADEQKNIENKINDIIKANLTITEEFLSEIEAKEKFNLERIPEGTVLDKVRIIKIGDYDTVPCIGPHVASTGKIGQFRIISSNFNEGVLRIRYKLQ